MSNRCAPSSRAAPLSVADLIRLAGSAETLGARLGVARTTVLDWRRINCIPGSRIGQIAAEFGVAAERLLPIVRHRTQPRDQ